MTNRAYQGHIARKRFGQNFLHDSFIIDSIVTAINPKPGQSVIEIGPGLGALTLPVAQRMDKLTVIELDRNLAARLQANPALTGKLNLYQQDALNTDFRQLAGQLTPPLRIFGNLPYNISTPLMFHLFRYADIITDMFFMLQKEVVDRLLALPGSSDYGRLTVMTQYHCDVSSVIEVPPTSFSPAPKVNSEVVCLKPHTSPPHLVPDINIISQLTAVAFNQRRKTLRNSLSTLLNRCELEALGLDAGVRAQNVTLAEYCRIACYLAERSAKEMHRE